MQLRYNGRKVDPAKFHPKKIDLRRLVGTCDCGATVRGQAALPAPDPYQSDINDDKTPVVMCGRCHENALQDI